VTTTITIRVVSAVFIPHIMVLAGIAVPIPTHIGMATTILGIGVAAYT